MILPQSTSIPYDAINGKPLSADALFWFESRGHARHAETDAKSMTHITNKSPLSLSRCTVEHLHCARYTACKIVRDIAYNEVRKALLERTQLKVAYAISHTTQNRILDSHLKFWYILLCCSILFFSTKMLINNLSFLLFIFHLTDAGAIGRQ